MAVDKLKGWHLTKKERPQKDGEYLILTYGIIGTYCSDHEVGDILPEIGSAEVEIDGNKIRWLGNFGSEAAPMFWREYPELPCVPENIVRKASEVKKKYEKKRDIQIQIDILKKELGKVERNEVVQDDEEEA